MAALVPDLPLLAQRKMENAHLAFLDARRQSEAFPFLLRRRSVAAAAARRTEANRKMTGLAAGFPALLQC